MCIRFLRIINPRDFVKFVSWKLSLKKKIIARELFLPGTINKVLSRTYVNWSKELGMHMTNRLYNIVSPFNFIFPRCLTRDVINAARLILFKFYD